MRRYQSVFNLVVLLVSIACSSEKGDDAIHTSGTSAGGTAGNPGSGPGTGLPSGSFCVRVGSGTERCSASGNTVDRTLSSGQISITVAHHSSGQCDAVCPSCRDPAEAVLTFSVPDGLPFPYQKSGSEASVQGYHRVNDGSCLWDSRSATFPLSGTVYKAGTSAATQVEGDLTLQTVDALCLPAKDACPNVSARLRFNLPL